LRASVQSASARKPKSPARGGPTHRLLDATPSSWRHRRARCRVQNALYRVRTPGQPRGRRPPSRRAGEPPGIRERHRRRGDRPAIGQRHVRVVTRRRPSTIAGDSVAIRATGGDGGRSGGGIARPWPPTHPAPGASRHVGTARPSPFLPGWVAVAAFHIQHLGRCDE
jgi:hypothetical protein